MKEAYVRLLCPACLKDWESTPSDLPAPHRTFYCPNCRDERPLAEFMRTEHDLQTLKSFS